MSINTKSFFNKKNLKKNSIKTKIKNIWGTFFKNWHKENNLKKKINYKIFIKCLQTKKLEFKFAKISLNKKFFKKYFL